MSVIKAILFSYLRSEAHYEFLVVFLNLLDKFPGVKQLVFALVLKFSGLLELEKKLVDPARKSPFTLKLEEADRRIDRDLTGINAAIQSGLHHYDPQVVDAARTLEDRLKDFGRIGGKAYEEESAAVQLLVGDLQTTLAVQAATVGITGWVEELNIAEQEFTQLFEQRNSELAARPKEHLTDVHREIETVYRQMIATIEADITLNGPAATAAFVAELNGQVTYFNEHAHRPARKDLGSATVESIPVQAYTGRPVIVIPAVHYAAEGKPARELVFATDFTVTYRRNVEVGTADLIIHGKGAYTGTKTVTFNIEGVAN